MEDAMLCVREHSTTGTRRLNPATRSEHSMGERTCELFRVRCEREVIQRSNSSAPLRSTPQETRERGAPLWCVALTLFDRRRTFVCIRGGQHTVVWTLREGERAP